MTVPTSPFKIGATPKRYSVAPTAYYPTLIPTGQNPMDDRCQSQQDQALALRSRW